MPNSRCPARVRVGKDPGLGGWIFLPLLEILWYSTRMKYRLACFLIALGFTGWFARHAQADTYELNDKTTLSGQPLAPDKRGILIKGDDGQISERVPWTNFTQTALKKISELPAAKALIEPYLEPDDPEPSKRAAAEITIKPVPRLARPDPKAGLGAVFSCSLSVILFLILYAANIYAGYEVSIFRNYPVGLVCGVAAVAPVIGPVLFLSLRTRIPPTGAELAEQQLAQEELVHAAEAAAEAVSAPAHGQGAPAHAATAAPKRPPPTIYQRGQTTFNRRFFETKLSGFLRIVPSEAEKDMVIVIRSARGEHSGPRISKVLPNELCLQIAKGGASADVTIPYTEIQEVQIRHKEA